MKILSNNELKIKHRIIYFIVLELYFNFETGTLREKLF